MTVIKKSSAEIARLKTFNRRKDFCSAKLRTGCLPRLTKYFRNHISKRDNGKKIKKQIVNKFASSAHSRPMLNNTQMLTSIEHFITKRLIARTFSVISFSFSKSRAVRDGPFLAISVQRLLSGFLGHNGKISRKILLRFIELTNPFGERNLY